jgi:hypothetical protein
MKTDKGEMRIEVKGENEALWLFWRRRRQVKNG